MTTPERPATAFTCRRARSGGVLFGLLLAFGVETGALHLALRANHPLIAWGLTLASVYAMWWLLADYRAMAAPAIRITDDSVELRIGLRLKAAIRLSNVAAAAGLTWRDLPTRSRDYVNATRPTEPNLLLTLREPVAVRLPGGITRAVRRIGLRLDEPDAFIARVACRAHVK